MYVGTEYILIVCMFPPTAANDACSACRPGFWGFFTVGGRGGRFTQYIRLLRCTYIGARPWHWRANTVLVSRAGRSIAPRMGTLREAQVPGRPRYPEWGRYLRYLHSPSTMGSNGGRPIPMDGREASAKSSNPPSMNWRACWSCRLSPITIAPDAKQATGRTTDYQPTWEHLNAGIPS